MDHFNSVSGVVTLTHNPAEGYVCSVLCNLYWICARVALVSCCKKSINVCQWQCPKKKFAVKEPVYRTCEMKQEHETGTQRLVLLYTVKIVKNTPNVGIASIISPAEEATTKYRGSCRSKRARQLRLCWMLTHLPVGVGKILAQMCYDQLRTSN